MFKKIVLSLSLLFCFQSYTHEKEGVLTDEQRASIIRLLAAYPPKSSRGPLLLAGLEEVAECEATHRNNCELLKFHKLHDHITLTLGIPLEAILYFYRAENLAKSA